MDRLVDRMVGLIALMVVLSISCLRGISNYLDFHFVLSEISLCLYLGRNDWMMSSCSLEIIVTQISAPYLCLFNFIWVFYPAVYWWLIKSIITFLYFLVQVLMLMFLSMWVIREIAFWCGCFLVIYMIAFRFALFVAFEGGWSLMCSCSRLRAIVVHAPSWNGWLRWTAVGSMPFCLILFTMHNDFIPICL